MAGLVEAANIDKYFEGRKPEWIIKTPNNFTRARVLAVAAKFLGKIRSVSGSSDSKRKKNTHAFCWHIDLENDIRSLQSIEPNSRWFFTAHHELGMATTTRLTRARRFRTCLRLGAAPGFHEGIGELISLASSQVPYLQSRGVLPHEFNADKTAFLLDDALARSVPFIYFSCGTMPHWEATSTRAIFRRSMERALVEIRFRIPRHRAAVATRRRILRCRHQDAHQ
jgi:Angiotensin-converting enzyme.